MAQKTVLVGVTGCIAAYKSCEIVRGLQKAGFRVKVVMTEHATKFVGPTTFRALTREPVAVSLFDEPGDPIHHISLAAEADLFLIAPCTANVMAKIAWGIADDLLSTTALATTAPLMIAPAMNVCMYEAAATRENMETLRSRGVGFVDAGEGYLACGDTGRGRLAEPADIVAAVVAKIGKARDLAGKTVMVTAGPTVEPIDPVRFISNRSSGKMGYAIAQAALDRGAEVTLISGPVAIDAPEGADVIRVQTACEMMEACSEAFPKADIAVFTAAVADMRPENVAEQKMKKGEDSEALSCIRLVENPDILATCAASKRDDQFIVGFAAETTDVVENAKQKLSRKNASMIVANQVGEGLVFGQDENTATFVKTNSVECLPTMSKAELADRILSEAI